MNEDSIELGRELVRQLPDPARHELPGHRLDLIREQLMVQISQDSDAEASTLTQSPTTNPRRRRHLVPALVGGALAVVVAVWATSALVFGVGRFWAGRTEAGGLLDRIALVAANSTDIPPLDQIRDEQFVYIETYGGWGGWGAVTSPDGGITGGWVAPDAHRRQIWVSVDGSQAGLLHDDDGDSQHVFEPNARPGLHSPTLRYLATLPTDPDLLLLKIYWENAGMGPNPQQEAFVTIGDLIRESVVPPDVAKALYQAAARIPGIEVVDDAVDALGRPGIAIARTHGGVRDEWIFDRETLQFLGERSVLTAEAEAPIPAGGSVENVPSPDGFVLGSTAVVVRAIVDVAGELPGT